MPIPELNAAIADAQSRLEGGEQLVARLLENHAEAIATAKTELSIAIAKVIVDRMKQQPSIASPTVQEEKVEVVGRSGRVPTSVRRQVLSAAAAGRQTPPVKTQDVHVQIESAMKHTLPVELRFVIEARPEIRADYGKFRDKLFQFVALMQITAEDISKMLSADGIVVDEIRKFVCVLQIGINGCNRLELDLTQGRKAATFAYAQALQETISSMPACNQNPAELERDLSLAWAVEPEGDDDVIFVPVLFNDTAARKVVRPPYSDADSQREYSEHLGGVVIRPVGAAWSAAHFSKLSLTPGFYRRWRPSAN